MGPKRLLTTEQEKTLVARYKAGESMNAIAVAEGLPRTTVKRTMERYGVKTKKDMLRPKVSDETRDEIVGLHLGGSTFPALAEQFDVSVKTIWRIVKEAGASLGKTGRPPRAV